MTQKPTTFYTIYRTIDDFVVELLCPPSPTITRLKSDDDSEYFEGLEAASKASATIKEPRQYLAVKAFNVKLGFVQRSHEAMQAKRAAWEQGEAL